MGWGVGGPGELEEKGALGERRKGPEYERMNKVPENSENGTDGEILSVNGLSCHFFCAYVSLYIHVHV